MSAPSYANKFGGTDLAHMAENYKLKKGDGTERESDLLKAKHEKKR